MGRADYIRSVVRSFLAITDSPVSPQPRDLELAEAWYSAGIPLPHVEHTFRTVVLRRLDLALDASPGSTRHGRIRSLYYLRDGMERCRLDPPDVRYLELIRDRFPDYIHRGWLAPPADDGVEEDH